MGAWHLRNMEALALVCYLNAGHPHRSQLTETLDLGEPGLGLGGHYCSEVSLERQPVC